MSKHHQARGKLRQHTRMHGYMLGEAVGGRTWAGHGGDNIEPKMLQTGSQDPEFLEAS